MKSIHFKLLTENDLPLLHNWFQKPHIKQWYNHPLFDNLKLNEIAGLDWFIADENYLKKSYATLTLTNFIKQHVQNIFILLVTDSLKINKNAIQFFKKNGFKKLPSHQSQSANELLVLHVT